MLLNTSLNGMSIEEINLGTDRCIKGTGRNPQQGDQRCAGCSSRDRFILKMDMEIYTSGATNIFKYPELSDSRERTVRLLRAFEEKAAAGRTGDTDLIQMRRTQESRYISENEAPVQTMKDCSVVTATYELGDGMKGTIGIIGPKRMDYETCNEDAEKASDGAGFHVWKE